MLENLLSAIEITLIGMGLVFAAIFLLWGVMVAMIRILEERKSTSQPAPHAEDEIAISPHPSDDRKLRAMAVAVACAIAQNERARRDFPLPPTAIVSAWQAVARSNMLKRGRVR
jgi:Na+-transporting methylmalonyl-CoA/oxaloacetate decarboxylase gamma subunit